MARWRKRVITVPAQSSAKLKTVGSNCGSSKVGHVSIFRDSIQSIPSTYGSNPQSSLKSRPNPTQSSLIQSNPIQSMDGSNPCPTLGSSNGQKRARASPPAWIARTGTIVDQRPSFGLWESAETLLPVTSASAETASSCVRSCERRTHARSSADRDRCCQVQFRRRRRDPNTYRCRSSVPVPAWFPLIKIAECGRVVSSKRTTREPSETRTYLHKMHIYIYQWWANHKSNHKYKSQIICKNDLNQNLIKNHK